MKYRKMEWGRMEAVVNKLGGMDGVHRLLSGKSVVRAATKRFPIWETLTTGGVSKEELEKRLMYEGVSVAPHAKDIMMSSEFTTSAEAHRVSFVRAQIEDLGFTKELRATETELFNRDRLSSFDLDLCEPEDAPSILLAHPYQLKGDHALGIAMKPIAVSNSDLGVSHILQLDGVFLIGQLDDGRYLLNGYQEDPGSRLWGSSWEFVFRYSPR